MRPYSAILCMILAALMMVALCACGRNGGEGEEESAAITATDRGQSDASSGTGGEATDALAKPDMEGRQDLVVLNWEEYENRPHGIQEGTVLKYGVTYVPEASLVSWDLAEGWLCRNIYEGLLYMYMNDPTDIRGCIAESWEHSDDYLTWTFQIRDGVRFTDGTVCDAYAVEKAWNYKNEESPYYFTNNNIDRWEALSEKEFVLHLSAPCAYLETALCSSALFVVSPTAVELYRSYDIRSAVGTGPYRIDSFSPRESIVLKANPDYYLEEKMPCIETVEFLDLQSKYRILEALLNGDIDGAGFVLGDFYDNVNYSVYHTLPEDGYDGIVVSCYGGARTIWLNAETVPAFQTREVREALCRLICFDEINDELYDGMGLVQDSLWTRGSFGYVPTDQFYYDRDEGQELLASVGMEASDIEFDVIIYEEEKTWYTPIQDDLLEAGVSMGFDIIPPESSSIPLLNGDWTMFSGSNGYSNKAPYAPWQLILKPEAIIKSCFQDIYNPALYQKMLGEYDEMYKAATWDDMIAHCRQLTKYVQDDFGALCGLQSPAFIALGKGFKNGVFFSEQYDLQAYYVYQ